MRSLGISRLQKVGGWQGRYWICEVAPYQKQGLLFALTVSDLKAMLLTDQELRGSRE